MLGILELENKPVSFPGALSVPETHPYPIRRLTVPGASVRTIVGGDRSIKDAYVASARKLEDDGVSAIIANCGFSAIFQADVSAAVAVPVVLSSLVLVPFVAATIPPGRKVGLLTYDAEKLEDDHFAAAGWSPRQIAIAIAGIEGTETWRALAAPAPEVSLSMLVNDVLAAVRSLLKAEPNTAALVFECAGFPAAAEIVRRETGLPVADYLSLAKMVMEMSPARAT
jgi:hypothetical protein